MALTTDAAMLLFYDIAGDTGNHDDWHSYEHLHERLSIPGFRRATRFLATAASPRYFVLYEVDGLEVATSPAYLARLNAPTAWTQAMMPRFRGMVRGFGSVVASGGTGLGSAARVLRLQPAPEQEAPLLQQLSAMAGSLAKQRGLVSVTLYRPAPPPPMTKEQAIRGADRALAWVLVVTAHDAEALPAATSLAAGLTAEAGDYRLHHTLTAEEVARTPAPPTLVDRRS